MFAYLEDCIRRGESLQAVREAENLMVFLPDLSPYHQGRLYRLAGRARADSGDPYAALKLFELSIPKSLEARDWDCLGLTRAECGMAWLTAGDYASAISYLNAYLLDFHKYDRARTYLGYVHYNAGLAHRRRWTFAQAIKHYLAAVDWYTEKGYVLQVGETHQNLAWLYCLSGHLEDAQRELEVAETFLPVCGSSFQVEQLVCRSLHFKAAGRVGDAMVLIEEILRPSRPGAQAVHRAHAARIAGDIAVALGQIDSAEFFAGLAVHHALKAKDTSVMTQVSLLRGAIHARKGESGMAAN